MNEAGSLTPNDLRNQEFRSKMRGYDPLEVSAVLEEVASQWEHLLADNLRLREQNESLNGQLKKFADLEQTLRDTLVLARKAAESEADTAKKEAALIIEQARMKGESLIREAEARAEEFRRQIYELQAQRGRLKGEMEALLRSFDDQLERFDARINGPSDEKPGTTTGPAKVPNSVPSRPSAGRADEPLSAAYESHGATVTVPAGEPPESPEDRSIDFDAALNRIFGEERDTPVPPTRKPSFADDHDAGERSRSEISSPSGESSSGNTDKRNTDSNQDSGADR